MRKILIWSPNYAPELTGIPPLVTDAAEWLAGRGHEVSVLTAFPNYPERQIFEGYRGRLTRRGSTNGVDIRRTWLRVRPGESFFDKGMYEASFAASSAPWALARIRRVDTVVCLVPTLLSSAIGAGITRTSGRRFVVWVQDLVLTAAEAVGELGDVQRRVLSATRWLESIPLRRADAIVTCSPGFVPYLCARGARLETIHTIPNWVDTSQITPLPEPRSRGEVRFLYTGNIGYTQGFATLVQAARQVGEGIRLELVGGGNALDEVHRLVEGIGTLRPAVPREAYAELLGSSDALVVIQRQIAANANLPSKIASYLAAGRPIVASIGLETPAAEILRASGGALVVAPEAPDVLAEAMRRLRDDVAFRRRLGASGRRYAEANLAKGPILERLERAFVGT